MKENKGTVWFASKYFILNNSEKSLFYSKFTIDIKESISQNFSHSLFLEQSKIILEDQINSQH